MIVLVKGMKMPKGCAGCDAEEYYENSYGDECGFFCPFGDKAYTSETRELKRLDDCPLVPVPPHVDLISREWLIDIALHLMNTAKNEDIANGVKWLWQYIIEAPTIIPAEEGEECTKT